MGDPSNVQDIGSNDSNQSKSGKVFIVDPNPPGMDIIPPEDMFIYVKFSAFPRSRTTYGGNTLEGDPIVFDSGIDGEVHFISTKISYKDGKLNPALQKTYATTDWTEIGGFKNESTKSAGILEGFGIKSIDIKYNASLVPVVDITFVDVRGAALFDVTQDNDRKSPYSIFFKMPYPVFRLSVKGYFGQKVDYCLNMVNWTSSFDNSTGNFEITANFLGFQQAFLNDMVLGNIIGVVNTQQGFNILNRIYDERNSSIGKESGFNIRKIDEFFTKISRLQVDSEIIKSDLSSFEYLKDLNGKLSLLKSIRTFIGDHMGKQPKSNSNGATATVTDSTPYINKENRDDIIFTKPIKDNTLQNNVNYLSIRDYIVFNSANRASFKKYIETLNELIKKYKEYLGGSDRKDYKPENSLSKLSDKLQKKVQKVPTNENKVTDKDSELINSFLLSANEADSWENYIVSPTKDATGKITPDRFENIIDLFRSENSNLYLKKDYVENSVKNSNFQLSLFTGSTSTFFRSLKKDTNVLVADFRKQRELLQYRIIELESLIKEQREIVQTEINESLLENFKKQFNFKPTVDNCFEIIANNTQAMVETIYSITSEAEQESKKNNRISILKRYETDTPEGIEKVAWPSIYQKTEGNGLEEIYIGDVDGINSVDFPEWKFTEEVFEILVAKKKSLEQVTIASNLKNGLDTDNWFPINPIDYKVNPWIKINTLNDEESITNELLKQIFFRIAILENYSRFNNNTGLSNIEEYANFESIAANKTIFSSDVRAILGNILNRLKNNQLDYKDSKFFKVNVEKSGNDFYLKEKDELPNYNGFKLSAKFSPDATYVLFDDKDILNNSKKLFSEIQQEKTYSKLTDQSAGGLINKEENTGTLIYKNKYVTSNNFSSNILYNVWDNSVGKNLLISSNNKFNDTLVGSKIIDFNPVEGSYESKYLNISNFSLKDDSTCDYEDIITQSQLYKKQDSNYARALLLLSTFPFRNFKEGFLDVLFPNKSYNGARIVKIPSMYLYYIGGLLWRYVEGLNNKPSIDFTKSLNDDCDYSKFSTPYTKYLKVGYYYDKDIDLEDSLKNLPESVKKELINRFKNWVDGKNRFNNNLTGLFEVNMTYYVNNPTDTFSLTITPENKKVGQEYILKELTSLTDFIILNPAIFDSTIVTDNKQILKIESSKIQAYINYFSTKFEEIEKNNNNGSQNNEEEQQSNNKSTSPLKLQLYNYFKNINSKWVGQDEKSFNICGGSDNKDLIDYFRFIDRGWRNIGNEATFNLKSFLTLGNNLDTSVYMFMSKLLRDSNFLFQILPTYINYKDINEVAKIFRPQTTLKTNESSGPIFCCIYIGGASEVLDIGERSNYYFKNDGYSFKDGTQIPPDMVKPDDSSLVAFRVAFGAQNQMIFTNLSLSQQEHKETGEYFKALSDLVDKRGGTQKTYVGTDLLRIFKTRSYTCKVDALGCMNIQPLMYFDLQNVPFFNGAYLITGVNHSISPNHMTTNFQGVRQSKFISPPTKDIVADLDIDLNDSSEIPKIEFTNLSIGNVLFSIGVRNGITPDDLFDFDTNFGGDTGIGNFKNSLGVIRNSDAEYRTLIDNLRTIAEENDIITNAQVTMFLTSMLANSNNLNRFEKEVEAGAEIRDVNNNVLFYSDKVEELKTNTTDEATNLTKYKDSYLASVPLSSVTSSIAYSLNGNPELDESNIGLGKIDKTKYYNVLKGDAYRFRPRGYLYMIGRKNYYDLSKKYYKSDAAAKDAIIDPDSVNETEIKRIKSSVAVWKTLESQSGKTAYYYSSIKNDGSASSFKMCSDMVFQGYGPDNTTTFTIFEKVLNTFVGKDKQPLIDYDNPVGGL